MSDSWIVSLIGSALMEFTWAPGNKEVTCDAKGANHKEITSDEKIPSNKESTDNCIGKVSKNKKVISDGKVPLSGKIPG